MDLKDYEIKNTIKCKCGHEFTIKDMKKLQRIENDAKFYGGIVKHFDEIKCPVCGRDTMLLIKQQGQTYVVKDIAQRKEQDAINVDDSKDNNETTNEIICSVCQRSFKNKSGLAKHMTTHNS